MFTALATAVTGSEAAWAQAVASKPNVEVPDRINSDPYELIGMENTADKKEDYKTFYMKSKYRQDTYQVMKHMKISASLDKGTPNMEKWNSRVKKEMNDWLALYRRQNLSVGRQSYYSLYSAINTLASHFTSYGPKFPFPNKRRPRFYELCNQVEKYLEKGK
ncbi:PSB27-1 [Symbiodinium sp. CCMP2456]|nr:PSB27-1 [Symbiodinium sp. CCMP2456]